ncbi:protein of unknown function [Paraburkholderia hospita]|uniref:DUF4297 domain-containing protein n=1 Tax=Paraburkholderia hospita TaxID=169430 RepID=A0AAN1J5V3_9BURK|nr:DUF4297 domain-containing protein [Paraburkholderia hospita]SEH40872.1 protein of unknown function [Paraburkholderia hospita]
MGEHPRHRRSTKRRGENVSAQNDSSDAEDSGTNADVWATLLTDPEINESGGEETNDGVDFARYWAMYLLVALERAKQNDYALLFEYIQDVALLDSADAPSSAALFQLKKRDRKDWSIASLCKRVDVDTVDNTQPAVGSKGQAELFASTDAEHEQHPPVAPNKSKRRGTTRLRGQSPLGKLYLGVAKLPPTVEAIGAFVSNAPLSAKLPSGSAPPLHSSLRFDSLCDSDTADISARLRKELGLQGLSHMPKLAFEHTKLQPSTMRETVRGALGELLVDELNLPDTSGQLVSKLLDSFSRLGGKKRILSSLQDIVSEKGFTKKAFSRLLESASTASDFGVEIEKMVSDLKGEGMPPKEANRIADAARRIAIRFIHMPEQRDTLCWQEALRFARSADATNETYRAMLEISCGQLSSLLDSRGAGDISSTDIKAVALLANIHVKNESQTPSA